MRIYAASEGGGAFATAEEWLKKPGTVGKASRAPVGELRQSSTTTETGWRQAKLARST
ncbi:hypothetical protein SMICM17S_06317 [Streptomyces microflavus]